MLSISPTNATSSLNAKNVKRPYEFSVFISSPGDIPDVRDLIANLCLEWTNSRGQEKDVRLAVRRWENMGITSGLSPQELINSELLHTADILIGVFWTKFGTETANYDSGTEEEIEEFVKAGKPVVLYFLDKPISPGDVDGPELTKIKQFKHRYKEKGVYRIVKSSEEIQKHFDRDISLNIEKLLAKLGAITDANNGKREGLALTSTQSTQVRQRSIEDAWFELSIRDLIVKYLVDNNLGYVSYKREITFEENCALWRGYANFSAVQETARKAREHAFNTKYGNYDYSEDLRDSYKRTWFKPVVEMLNGFNLSESSRIVGIGSNDGRELLEISAHLHCKPNIEVLDMSGAAIARGKLNNSSAVFYVGNMEQTPLQSEYYDVCLNLRSIHSSGVEMRSALSETFRVLRKPGLVIISISNGYLVKQSDPKAPLTEVKGMYTRAGAFSKDKPYRLAEQIREKLDDYGFEDTGMTTGPSELFVFGIKR